MDVITPQQQERRYRHLEREHSQALMKIYNEAYQAKDYFKAKKILNLGTRLFGWDGDYTAGIDDGEEIKN